MDYIERVTGMMAKVLVAVFQDRDSTWQNGNNTILVTWTLFNC